MNCSTAYGIRHRVVRADTASWLHKNAPHTGTRYVIVLYNKDLNYKGSTECARSVAVRGAAALERPEYLKTREGEDVARARDNLLTVLERSTLPLDRCGNGAALHEKYASNPARLLSFGVSASRQSRAKRAARGLLTRATPNLNNVRYPAVYRALCAYLDALAPGLFAPDGEYHACIVAKDAQCVWHRDKRNIGHAALTALGMFEGGVLLIQTPASGP